MFVDKDSIHLILQFYWWLFLLYCIDLTLVTIQPINFMMWLTNSFHFLKRLAPSSSSASKLSKYRPCDRSVQHVGDEHLQQVRIFCLIWLKTFGVNTQYNKQFMNPCKLSPNAWRIREVKIIFKKSLNVQYLK